jgi:hypothetical protein
MLEQGSLKSGNITLKLTDALGNVINPAINSMNISGYDYISISYNDPAFTETYVFKTGGSGGATVATIVVVYVDATKVKLVSVTKT